MDLFLIGIFILFTAGILSVIGDKFKFILLQILVTLGAICVLRPAIEVILSGEAKILSMDFNNIFGIINFVLDPLSAFFAIVIAIMSTVCVFYAKGYLKSYLEDNIRSNLIFLPVLIASMLLVVTCQNAFMFLICWEIMSLSSFFLVIFENEKKEVLRAGIKYLVFMHISMIFILIAFTILSLNSGSYDFSSFIEILQNNMHLTNIVFLLLFIGFGTKAGFVPFHNWLPDAHPVAPSHVSAMMSGVMIKTGIYGILRFLCLIGIPPKGLAYAVIIISVLTFLYGILYAITQEDIKKMLAYSSIENIGIIGLGMGIGMIGLAYNSGIVAILGFAGCLLHILNHSIFKELLFFAVGNVYNKTHTKNVEAFGGLIKSIPFTAVMFLVGAIAISGLPPFNGFVSEFLIYFGMLKGLSIHNFFSLITILFSIAGLALVGTMAILCFTKMFSIIFLGMPRDKVSSNVNSDCDKSMLFSMGFLVCLIVIIGLFPQDAFMFIIKPVESIIGNLSIELSEPVMLMRFISYIALSFLIILLALILLKLKFTKNRVILHETWGCGYNKPNNKMQYTASSYVNPLLIMLSPLFKKIYDIEKPKKLFPQTAHFHMKIEDIEEAYLINPVIKTDEWFLSKFEGLQSGNIQSYIKYGLIFLLVILIGSFMGI